MPSDDGSSSELEPDSCNYMLQSWSEFGFGGKTWPGSCRYPRSEWLQDVVRVQGYVSDNVSSSALFISHERVLAVSVWCVSLMLSTLFVLDLLV